MKKLIALLLLVASQAFGASVNVSDPNCPVFVATQTGSDLAITCGQPSTPTPTCTLTAVPSTIVAGQPVSLNTLCQPGATSWTWGGVVSSLASASDYPTATKTYTFTGANQYGQGNTSSATVTVTQPVQNTCDSSMARDAVNAQMRSVGAGRAVAYSFVAPSQYGGQAQLQYLSGTASISISQNACDFSSAISYKCMTTGDVSPTINYTPNDTRMCILTPGVTYYFNVKMSDGSAGSFMVF